MKLKPSTKINKIIQQHMNQRSEVHHASPCQFHRGSWVTKALHGLSKSPCWMCHRKIKLRSIQLLMAKTSHSCCHFNPLHAKQLSQKAACTFGVHDCPQHCSLAVEQEGCGHCFWALRNQRDHRRKGAGGLERCESMRMEVCKPPYKV